MAKREWKRSYVERDWPLKSRHNFYTDKSGGPDACWPWKASRNKGGYGLATVPCSGQELAHRQSYKVNVGPIPDGLWVLHKCDNRCCQNPRHLFLGTRLDNVRDMHAKGRAADHRGTENPKAKLTPEEVRAIRKATGDQWVIGAKFGVEQSTVSSIKLRKTWKHIP
jgi:Autographiviridae endonuclease